MLRTLNQHRKQKFRAKHPIHADEVVDTVPNQTVVNYLTHKGVI